MNKSKKERNNELKRRAEKKLEIWNEALGDNSKTIMKNFLNNMRSRGKNRAKNDQSF